MKVKLIGLALLLACVAPAAESISPTLKSALSEVSPPELPAKAAALVKDAKASEREAITAEVVRTAVTLNPNSAPAVVSAVARAVPKMAPQAAATAVSLQPTQAATIAKAAAAAAPSNVEKTVTAICRVSPKSCKVVAVAAAQAVPGSDKKVLRAVAAAIPELKPGIEQGLEASGKNISVAAVLDMAVNYLASNTRTDSKTGGQRGPAVGPPYIPLSGTPVNISPASSTDVPPGGRDYTTP